MNPRRPLCWRTDWRNEGSGRSSIACAPFLGPVASTSRGSKGALLRFGRVKRGEGAEFSSRTHFCPIRPTCLFSPASFVAALSRPGRPRGPAAGHRGVNAALPLLASGDPGQRQTLGTHHPTPAASHPTLRRPQKVVAGHPGS